MARIGWAAVSVLHVLQFGRTITDLETLSIRKEAGGPCPCLFLRFDLTGTTSILAFASANCKGDKDDADSLVLSLCFETDCAASIWALIQVAMRLRPEAHK